MPTHPFKQVDVFSARPFFGNPVAVVANADALPVQEMQRIAAWTNLSETTFVLTASSPGPAYRLRIFTPEHELPFAGHPTLGSCHAVLEWGLLEPRNGRLVQECGAGALPLRIEGEGPARRIYVEAPEAKWVGEFPQLAHSASAALGRPIAAAPVPAALRNGPNWLFVRFEREADVAALRPDMARVAQLSREHSVRGSRRSPSSTTASSPSTSAASRRRSGSPRIPSRAVPMRRCRPTWPATACWSGRAASTSRPRPPRWVGTGASTCGSWTMPGGPRSAARR